MPDSNESPRKNKKKKIFCEQETLSPCTSILPAHQAAKFACIGDTDAINDLLIDVTAAVQNDDLKSLTITYSNNTESSKYSLTQPKLLLTLPKSTQTDHGVYTRPYSLSYLPFCLSHSPYQTRSDSA